MILSCNPKIADEIEKGDKMMIVLNTKYSTAQFDSMCVIDTLPRSLAYWTFLGLKTYEGKEKTSLFLYIKSNGRNETMYRAEETMDDSVKIIKRAGERGTK